MDTSKKAHDAVDQLIVIQAENIRLMLEQGMKSGRPNDVISEDYMNAIRTLNETIRAYSTISLGD